MSDRLSREGCYGLLVRSHAVVSSPCKGIIWARAAYRQKHETEFMAEDKNKFLPVTSLLPCPEHHIRSRRGTPSRDAITVRNTFPFLELDIIRCDNIGKEPLDFIDRKESSRTDGKQ
jgi:hypothetical protein